MKLYNNNILYLIIFIFQSQPKGQEEEGVVIWLQPR